MGEYAVRISDNKEIKIGTCEDMYYLRFEDRAKVRRLSGNVDVNINAEAGECRFRLPFPDEDGIEPGNYEEYNRSQELYSDNRRYYTDAPKDTGIIQLHHESGILINVPCYHGAKLPDVRGEKDVAVFWNGRDPGHIVLSSLRAVYHEGRLSILPVLRCKYCSHAWRVPWISIWEYIPYEMRVVLRQYVPGLRS